MDVVTARLGRFVDQIVKPRAQAFLDAWLDSSEDISIDAAGTVLRLAGMQPAERADALKSLAQLQPAEILTVVIYDSVIAKLVSDDMGDVRAAALWLLGKMQYLQQKAGAAIARRNNVDYGDTFEECIKDTDAQVRRIALMSLAYGHLGQQRLESCQGLAAERLHDIDGFVRTAAVLLLGHLQVHELKKYIDKMATMLDDVDADVVLEVLTAYRRLDPSELNKYSAKLCKLLHDEDTRVRERALPVVLALDPEALVDSAAVLVDFLGDENSTMRGLVAQSLHHIEPALIPKYAARLVKWIGSTDEVVRLAVMEAIARHPAQLLHVRAAESGDTALHIAAREGNLEACKWLVSLGALIKTKNRLGQTPEAIAQKAHHMHLFRFFSRLENLTTTRGGLGDALSAALADNRQITRVEWHMIPLPGVAGYLGGIHSLLAVTVGTRGAEGMHTYVIEKAALIRGVIQDDPEQFKNGVHVSHWRDVLPNVESDALFTLGTREIVNNTGRPNFCMRTLRDLAVDLGPYDVGACNCHHAALLVYNACAKESAQVPRMPNSFLTGLAWGLSGIGIDVTNSGSGSIQSRSVSAHSTSIGSVSQSAVAPMPLAGVHEGEFENPFAESMDLPGFSFARPAARQSSKGSGAVSFVHKRTKRPWLPAAVPCCGEGLQAFASRFSRQCP